MLRRNLLSTTAVGLALGGCSTLTGVNTAVAAASSDVNIIATGLGDVLAQLGGLGIPASIVSIVTDAVNGLKSVSAALSATTSTTSAVPLVQQIEGYVNTVVKVLATASLALPSPITLALQGAALLLPVIESVIGMLVTPAPMATTVHMTPAEARIALKTVGLTTMKK